MAEEIHAHYCTNSPPKPENTMHVPTVLCMYKHMHTDKVSMDAIFKCYIHVIQWNPSKADRHLGDLVK